MTQETNIESQNMLPIGATLQGGKYRVDKHLSSGGFGNTYVVTNTKFDETFAMKEFFMKDVCERDGHNTVSVSNSGNQDSFDQQRAKFNKEAQRIRKFNNPHIVKVHDLFDENGTSYYIMDYIDGASLADTMKQMGKPFSEQDVRRFLPQILDGLEEVHKQNIWHLDLHPKNIMLDKAGNIVLIDFGASKQLNPDNRFSTSSAFCYHQGYAPTEQIDQNITRIGAWTDLYALGATLYNLLTKQPPLSTSEIQEGEAFTYPHPVSAEMQELIKWMMLPNRKERPQSVMDVRAFLRQDADVTIVVDNKDSGEDKTRFTVETPTANVKDSGKEPNRTNIRNIIITAVLAAVSVVGVSLKKIQAPQPVVQQPTTTTTTTTPSSASSQTITANGVSFKMIRVDGGTFTMGATSEQGSGAYDDEKPAHRVTLSSYYIGETEVTQALWEAVMGNNPSRFKGANRPVEQVSWNDCKTFISKLNSITGKNFRLPTEAEWEFAARGGNKSNGYKYSGSNTLGNVAWYDDNSGDETHNVKTKSPNELGIYDMSGNVWEWCQDWKGSYPSEAQTNPTGPSSGSGRVGRGGSWGSIAAYCRVADRDGNTPADTYGSLGFRLAQ